MKYHLGLSILVAALAGNARAQDEFKQRIYLESVLITALLTMADGDGLALEMGDDVTVGHGARAKRREVRPRLGFGESLAPDLLPAEDGRQVARLLLVGAVGGDGRCGGLDWA